MADILAGVPAAVSTAWSVVVSDIGAWQVAWLAVGVSVYVASTVWDDMLLREMPEDWGIPRDERPPSDDVDDMNFRTDRWEAGRSWLGRLFPVVQEWEDNAEAKRIVAADLERRRRTWRAHLVEKRTQWALSLTGRVIGVDLVRLRDEVADAERRRTKARRGKRRAVGSSRKSGGAWDRVFSGEAGEGERADSEAARREARIERWLARERRREVFWSLREERGQDEDCE